MMESIGEEKVNVREINKYLAIFEPDEEGKKIVKIQVKNGKLDIQYEGGE